MLKAMLHRAKTPFCLALLSLIVLTQSCKKTDLQKETVTPAQVEELRSFVANSTGMPLSEVQYNAARQFFTVAKDGIIGLEDAQTRLKAAPTAGSQSTERTGQRVYTYTVSP